VSWPQKTGFGMVEHSQVILFVAAQFIARYQERRINSPTTNGHARRFLFSAILRHPWCWRPEYYYHEERGFFLTGQERVAFFTENKYTVHSLLRL
jgi:hypothetical protein